MARFISALVFSFAYFSICYLHVQGLAVGPQVFSISGKTATAARELLNDGDFMVDLHTDRHLLKAPDSFVEKANVGKHDVFGLSDVQSAVERVFLPNGAIAPSHSHPRASETLYVEKGELMSSLRFEGDENARVVRLTLGVGRVTAFPQGLPHRLRCSSEAGCIYISFYNSADYGVVAAPNFV